MTARAPGFLAANRIWPDEKTAIVALTNNDWAGPDDLVNRIAFVVLAPNPQEARARSVFAQFQSGTIDRALFTSGGNSLLTAQALADLKASLGPLGPARLIELEHESKRGGMITRRWKILCRSMRLRGTRAGLPRRPVGRVSCNCNKRLILDLISANNRPQHDPRQPHVLEDSPAAAAA